MTATLTLTPTAPRLCPLSGTLQRVTPHRLMGTYTAFNRSVAETGTVDLIRQ
jgi:hypothetical protein